MTDSIEDINKPFWDSHPIEASGRDPLAIQNSSVVIARFKTYEIT